MYANNRTRHIAGLIAVFLISISCTVSSFASLTNADAIRTINTMSERIAEIIKAENGISTLPPKAYPKGAKIVQDERLMEKILYDKKYHDGRRSSLASSFTDKKDAKKYETYLSLYFFRYCRQNLVYLVSTLKDKPSGRWKTCVYDQKDDAKSCAMQRKCMSVSKKYAGDFRKELSAYRKAKKKTLSEVERFTFAANYVANRLSYADDKRVYINGKKYKTGNNLYVAYKTGYGVCDDYANLMCIVCKEAGIKCFYVSGASKKKDEQGHAWNIVKLKGKYFYIDVTWCDEGKYLTLPWFLPPELPYPGRFLSSNLTSLGNGYINPTIEHR